jgi:predicted DNA-binding transcriptional regulator AlpA
MSEKSEELLEGLHPDQLVRQKDGGKYFGLGHTRLDEAIKAGLIPRPFSVLPGGRAKGWTGRQIIEHHRKRQEAEAAASEKITPLLSKAKSKVTA